MKYPEYINSFLSTKANKVSIDISDAVKKTNSKATHLNFKQRLAIDLKKAGYTFYHNKSSTVVLLS